MAPGGITLNIDPIPSQLSVAGSASTGQGTDTSAQAADKTTIQKASSSPVDTVSITNKNRETAPEASKDKSGRESNKQGQQPVRAMQDVLFAYNFKGKLRIRFMDSANRLIYQIPPVMVARTQDLMQRSQLAVDMRA